ncbi:MAG: hypothetical protein IKS87_02330 [Lachnospiraceae bacterium]|nr:hypothetical protein [Lachnospiraceae bacterium]
MSNTEKLVITNTEECLRRALNEADAFIGAQQLAKREALHLRLLVEETLGMVRAMAGDFGALFWIEKDDEDYKIRLSVRTEMSKEKKDELLSVARSGKNAAARGFMGKVREIIENSMLNFDDVMKLQEKYDGGYISYAHMGMNAPGEPLITGDLMMWKLSTYKDSLKGSQEEQAHREAWDELEKSIVAKLAKDVVVGVKKDSVEMTIVG